MMFSSNDTPAEEIQFARELGATINLDAYEDAYLQEVASIPEIIFAAITQAVFELGTDYGFPEEATRMTKEQLIQAFKDLKSLALKIWDSCLISF